MKREGGRDGERQAQAMKSREWGEGKTGVGGLRKRWGIGAGQGREREERKEEAGTRQGRALNGEEVGSAARGVSVGEAGLGEGRVGGYKACGQVTRCPRLALTTFTHARTLLPPPPPSERYVLSASIINDVFISLFSYSFVC